MGHGLVRATVLPEIIRLISERLKITESEAMDLFYTSGTDKNFSDDETGGTDNLRYIFTDGLWKNGGRK